MVLGVGVKDSGFRVWVLGFMVQGEGLGFGISEIGFRVGVEGSGLRI